MGTRGRVWRVGKWVGVAASVLLVLAWGSTLACTTIFDGWRWGATLVEGTFELEIRPWTIRDLELYFGDDPVVYPEYVPAGFIVEPRHARMRACTGPLEFSYWDAFWPGVPKINRSAMPVSLWSENENDRDRMFSVYYVDVPLPFMILIVFVPTAFICFRDRRRVPVGRCWGCGYDLTKNESGVCPECGRIVDCGM